jgi:hypothetical protein
MSARQKLASSCLSHFSSLLTVSLSRSRNDFVSAEPTELSQAKSHDVTCSTPRGRAQWIEQFSSIVMNLELLYFYWYKTDSYWH